MTHYILSPPIQPRPSKHFSEMKTLATRSAANDTSSGMPSANEAPMAMAFPGHGGAPSSQDGKGKSIYEWMIGGGSLYFRKPINDIHNFWVVLVYKLAQPCNPTAKGSSKVPGLFRFFGVCIFVSPVPGHRD